jgi:putative transposase
VGNRRNRKSEPRGGERIVAHTSSNLAVHLIFSTKARQPLIEPAFRADLFAYLGGIVRELQGAALIVNGSADHVHLLLRIRPAQSVADVARVIKANSSRWVRGKWSPHFAWQKGCGAFSVSESNTAAVMKYIAEQEDHHKRRSFQEEFVAFLQKNGIAYDERYIWS